jgi:hypothetical protein
MRLAVIGVVAAGLATVLSGCVAVDLEDPVERAAAGTVLGGAGGAAVGATFGINPGYGALIGAEIGMPLGAAIGVATAPPKPSYAPIPVPTEAVIPNFYDGWPPGYRLPPNLPEAQPPREG